MINLILVFEVLSEVAKFKIINLDRWIDPVGSRCVAPMCP